MRLSRIALTLAALLALSGVAYVAQLTPPTTPVAMADAATAWLVTLTPEQKAAAQYAYDSPERTNWHFVPHQEKGKALRKGLRLQDMTAPQRDAALKLLKVGTSPEGFEQAAAIMSLERVLRELEKGGNVRDPDWYFFTVFGEPSKSGAWGWRFEGHHLSLNYTLAAGQVTAFTPAFYGSNPALVKSGPRQGFRALSTVDDAARALIVALPAAQKAKAKADKQFPEIEEKPAAKAAAPVGISYGELAAPQQAQLTALIDAYVKRMPADVAQAERDLIAAGGWDKVHFAWAGSLEPGQPMSYRVHGPSFVAEYVNVQADSAKNPANHIHSAWRRLPQDFGLTVARGG